MTAVAVAATVEDVQEAVRQGAEQPRVLPVAGATKPALSSSARDDAVALDVSALRGIVEYDPAELTLTARAATPVAEVADALAKHGQYLPFDPPLAVAGATLGGAVAAGTSGANAFRHGGVRDFVIGVRFVDGTGRLVAGGGKVVKNAAGFDLPKLMVGSIGRLGVMVQLSFKVFPCPRATTTLEFSLPTVSAAIEAASFLNRGPLDLDALDILPGGDLLVRLGGHPDALDARAERLGAQLQAPARRYSGHAEGVLWTDAAELSWIPAGSAIVRVALTPRTAAALDLAMTRANATVRYGLGANVAWVAWPAGTSLDRLDAALRSLELSGVVLTGPAARPLLGLERGGAFGARVRSALDPFARFLGD